MVDISGICFGSISQSLDEQRDKARVPDSQTCCQYCWLVRREAEKTMSKRLTEEATTHLVEGSWLDYIGGQL
jgi:hypothetical protein